MLQEEAGNAARDQRGDQRSLADALDGSYIVEGEGGCEADQQYVIGGLYLAKINVEMAGYCIDDAFAWQHKDIGDALDGYAKGDKRRTKQEWQKLQ